MQNFTNEDLEEQERVEAYIQNHSPYLIQHFNQVYKTTATDIKIISLQMRYVVTDKINNKKKRLTVPFSADFLSNSWASDKVEDSVSTINFATCTECRATGPLGQYCDKEECEDSSNIYADPL